MTTLLKWTATLSAAIVLLSLATIAACTALDYILAGLIHIIQFVVTVL